MRTLALGVCAYAAFGSGLLFAQSLTGNLDAAGCGSITGWAYNGSTTQISVDFYDGATFITTVVANQNSGSDSIINGVEHGFVLYTPSTLKDNQIHTIYARYSGTTVNLGSDPRTIQCDSSSTGYQYYYTDTLETINTATDWYQNGTAAVLSGWGLSTTTAGGGSLISKLAVQGPSSTNYEVNATLALNASGGDYVEYLRASTNALTGTGTYFSVEIQNPTFSTNNGVVSCSATLAAYNSVNGTVTQLYSTPISCQNGMQLRTMITGSCAIMILGPINHSVCGITPTSGPPGIGGRSMPSTNAISLVELGPQDQVAPSPINASTFATTVYANSVTAEWQGAVDDANGVGIGAYVIYRTDGLYIYSYDASFYDATVQPNTTYTYQVSAHDLNGNASAVSSFTVTTPPSGAIDPRRIGIRPTGSYWGGAGEQIDLLSGNLNYSIPLITAMARGGMSASFALAYNSQNWRTVATSATPLGADVGYGFGWQLLLGSLMPVYGTTATVQYYLFTDSTGAQYQLNQQTGTVWSSSQSTYVWYDTNANRLYFRSGTYWLMGCTSAGGESDAGTMYPTLVEDTNGNQIIVHYMAGLSANWVDSSARISTIEDARAVVYTDPVTEDQLYRSYSFTYTTGSNGLSYLSSITSYVNTPENYTFTINQGTAIYSPGGTSFGTAGLLMHVITTGLGYEYNLIYSGEYGGTDGDLTQVQVPQGGKLTWGYTSFIYNGNRSYEEVNKRYLTPSGTQYTYTFVRNDPSNSVTVHSAVALDDASGTEKYWAFNTNTATPWNLGLVSDFQHRSAPGVTPPVRDESYTWVQDAAGDAYLGTVQTTLNQGQSYAAATKTVQTQDSYGNLLTSSVYDYNSLTTPARSYANTYLYQNNTNYSSRYIFNRLLTSTLASVTLASNVYDGGVLNPTSGSPREWDAENYGASFAYRGNVTQANSPGKTTNVTYDTTGTAIEKDDNNNHSVNIATSTATNFTLPDSLSPNGASSLQTNAAYNATGYAPTSIAGPSQTINNGSSGNAAYTSYDSYGRVSYTLAPSQSWTTNNGAQTNYSYSYTSGAWAVTATTNNAGGSSHYTTTTSDGFGRTTRVQSGYGTTAVSTVDTVYAPCACSPLGKMSQQSEPYAGGTEVYTTYSYDALGRPVKILLADGASYTSYIYQGNFTAVVDPANNWKLYAKDALGNLVTVLEPDPLATPLVTSPPSPPPAYPVTAAPAGMLLTTYTYDQFNHLTQVAMPRSTANGMKTQTRTFAYTATAHPNINLPALWLTSATNPESGTVSYTYNSDGTLASKTDANGNTETYTYDVYQRLTSIPDRQQTFTYDTCPAAARGCVSMAGQLMQTVFGTAVGPNGLTLEYNYSYTPAGKVSGKTLQLTGGVGLQASTGTVTASYTFDGQGALTQTSYTPAYFVNTFNYTLDAMERPTGMTDNLSHTWVTGATYNAANQMTSNGIQTWTYNSLYQITGVTGTGMNMTYNYSATQNNGQIASSVDSVKSETIDYQYDLLKRLSSATATSGAWGESYVYDGYGNLTQMNPTAGAPPSMNLTVQADANGVPTNQITGTYDNNGNLKWLGNNTSLSYDAANRLNMVLANGQFSYYGYDADNRRVWYQNASGVQTIYFYGADGRKVTSYTFTMSAPNIVMTPAQNYGNIYFAGVPLETEGNAVSTDRLGSVRNGGGAGYQAEYPYGTEYSLTANDREKYATYTRDSVSSLDYAVNRYYWSQWGRFISPDPYGGSANLVNPLSWNRYSYVGNDPLNHKDPQGLCSVVIGGITQTPYTPDSATEAGFASAIGAISAFPYAGGSIPGGGANVLAQGLGLPTGATLTAIQAISLAAESQGPIDIVAFSGGAQAFTSAWGYLNAATRSRIGSITYVDPGSVGTLQAGNPGTWGNPGTDVKVLEDSADFVNTFMQLIGAMGTPTSPNPATAEYVSTGTCGHNLSCVLTNFADWLASGTSACSTGAGGVFGAPSTSSLSIGYGAGLGNWMSWAWIDLPATPSVSSTINWQLGSL